jgi:hypothetical protein
MTEADVLSMMAMSSEFDQIRSRENEHGELKKLQENACAFYIRVSTIFFFFFFFFFLLNNENVGVIDNNVFINRVVLKIHMEK